MTRPSAVAGLLVLLGTVACGGDVPAVGTTRKFAPTNADHAWIPPGTFFMGCTTGDPACDVDETRHPVTLSHGFWLMTTEVTVGQYRAFAEATDRKPLAAPPFAQGDDHPAVYPSWDDARDYCTWAGGRLPTEAEWEYAARGGAADSSFPWSGPISRERANYGAERCCEGKAEGADRWVETAPVGSFGANGFGLFDMAGNVREWCADWYAPQFDGASPAIDPTGPKEGRGRVNRGGSWYDEPPFQRVSMRDRAAPWMSADVLGFRCARDETR